MRTTALFLLAIATVSCFAQWDVPVRVVLNGDQEVDRQVLGLSAPQEASAGMSVDAVRDQRATFTTVTGTSLLSGALVPSPTAYLPGMIVTIIPAETNAPGAQLDLNGLGAQPMVKAGGLPLDSADLLAGAPARLIHDGSRFHLIGEAFIPCPAGFHVGGREYCIEDSSRSDTTFYWAARRCRDSDARLCTFSEWTHACRSDSSFFLTVLDYEWIDSGANDTNDAKTVGNGGDGLGGPSFISCEHGGTTLPTTSRRYRCCTSR